MKQENKDLLLKYLCMALPYGVKGLRTYNKEEVVELSGILPCNVSGNSDGSFIELQFTNLDCCVIEKYKPYLRPMSSMTVDEFQELFELLYYVESLNFSDIIFKNKGEIFNVYDWLLKKHFDFMGLIPKGLAIEVTESNNPYK